VSYDGTRYAVGAQTLVLLALGMLQASVALLQIRNSWLLFPMAVFLVLLAYEFKSGNAIDLRWGRFVTKRDRPTAYWGMIGIKAVFILFLLYKAFS
jgi:hypothetical protein